jgi:uncharacterized protein (TIRG00374 family)
MALDVGEIVDRAQSAAHRASRVRRMVRLALAVAAVLLVVANRGDLPAAWQALRSARAGWLVALSLLVVVYLLDQGARHVVAQRAVWLSPRWESMLPAAWAAHFVNAVSKSGGFAGIAVLSAEGRRSDKPHGQVLAAGLLVAVLDQLAFAAVVPFAILALLLDGRFSTADGAATGVFALYLCATVGVVIAAARGRSSIHALYSLPGRLSAWLQRVVLRRPVRYQPDPDRADELFEAIELVKRRPRTAVPAALTAVAVDLLAVLELWVALRAVGVDVGLAVPFVAYSISTLFAVVGLVPGGIGVVELSVGAVLHSFGIPLVLAAAAVVLFRVAEFWIPLAVGAVVSHRYIPRATAEAS